MIVALVLLFDMIELIRRAAAYPDMSFAVLLGMALLKLPQMVNTVLPFAVMLSSMAVFWQFSRSRELVIIRAVGVSAWQFLLPVLWIVLLLGISNLTLLNPLGANLYARYARMENALLLRKTNTPLSLAGNITNLWWYELIGNRQSVLHAERTCQDGPILYMRDVSIFLFKNRGVFLERVEATSGMLLKDGTYKLYRVWILQSGHSAAYHDILSLPTNLTIDCIREHSSSPETVSVWQLSSSIRLCQEAGLSTYVHRLYLKALIASPFLLCAIVLVAAAFAMPQNHRNARVGVRMTGAISVGFLLYFFSKITYALGQAALLPLEVAAWSPAVIMGSLGLAALLHLEDG
ncbi:Permease, YjgP/YjgQ family [invertebrate metagenome]|uniref:Permease, YjgP/YjgQ family n=1 Tax=invertebrate metagenome TaxID=1711999 RepID=A0A484HB35_9ZZZZ